MSPTKIIRTNRAAETFAFITGVLLLAFHGVADVLLDLGWRLGDTNRPNGVPWSVIITACVLIAPKMLGRANATGIIKAGLDALTLRLRGTGASSATITTQAPGQPEKTVAKVETPPGGGEAKVTIPANPDHPDGVEEGVPVPITGIPLERDPRDGVEPTP